MKQIKQLATSKRMGFAALLNTGWIIATLSDLYQVRTTADALTEGYPFGEYIGMGIVLIAFVGMAWTKLHDDSNQ